MASHRLPESLITPLSDWRPSADNALVLRAAFSNALNKAAAGRCLDILAAREPSVSDALQSTLPELLRAGWTTPAVAYANYVGFSEADPLPQARIAAQELLRIASAPPPPLNIAPTDLDAPWVRYALRIFERDQRNDNRVVELRPIEPTETLRSDAAGALSLLEAVWPEMCATVITFTREIRWFTSNVRASGSASLTQGYGAIFIDSTGGKIKLLEHLLHESTHLEFTARMALDKYIVNGKDPAISPFRVNPRPLTRVLHATVVAARLIDVLDRLSDAGIGDSEYLASTRERFVRDLDFGLGSMGEHAQWTPLGEELFSGMQPAVPA